MPRSHLALRRLAPLAVAALLGFAVRSDPPANLVAYGRVWTGDSAKPWAGAVATRGDTIVAVGDSATVAALVGPKTTVLSNGKAMVVPGLMDGHLHFTDGGFQLASVDLRSSRSPEEFIARLKAYATERQPGEWILGGDWDHENWPGAPLPTKEWIDSVTPDNPVFVSRLDGHMGLANSAALRLAGIGPRTKDIPGGVIVRDPRTHEPTGILKDGAMSPVYGAMPAPSAEQLDAALRRAMTFVASKGVTAIAHVSASPAELAHLSARRAGGTLTVRAALYFPLESWKRGGGLRHRTRPGRRMGSDRRREGVHGRVARLTHRPLLRALSGRSQDERDAEKPRGIASHLDRRRRTRRGFRLRFTRSASAPTAFFWTSTTAWPRRTGAGTAASVSSTRSTCAPRTSTGSRARGVVASMQPYHAIDDGRWAEKRIGPERIKTTYAFRDLLDLHAHLGFGSDWTVAPIDPILGIYAAVTRRTLDGKNPRGWVPEQKITVEEALRAYTSGDAYGVFAENTRGKLKPGYRADLVLLDKDLTAIPPETIERVKVRNTVVGGRVVFSAP